MLNSSSAINNRVAFEITCNLEYICNHNQPENVIEKMKEFTQYEGVFFLKEVNSDVFSKEEERSFLKKYPQFGNKNEELKSNYYWASSIAKNINSLGSLIRSYLPEREKQFSDVYKLGCLFVHGSPLVGEFYKNNENMFSCIPKAPLRISAMNMLTARFVLEALMEFSEFSGNSFDRDLFEDLFRRFDEKVNR